MKFRREARAVAGLLPATLLVGACQAAVSQAPASPVETPANVSTAAPERVALNPALEAKLAQWEKLGPSGDDAHREQLAQLVRVVGDRLTQSGKADLLFVCTHNSRRSHMAQLLAAAAARRTGVGGVRTYSGGTEATAFNPRAVAALERVGFDITTNGEEKNPRYKVRFSPSAEPQEVFSKRYMDPPNPSQGFVAVMTCSQADAACPFVQGAVARLAIPYEDPKVADGTPGEAAKYDERVEQIGRDLGWVFGELQRRGEKAKVGASR